MRRLYMKKKIRQAVRPRTTAIVIALTMIAAAFLSGCAGPPSPAKPSRTDKAFEGITEESGMHLCTELDDENGAIRLDMYRKADNLYIDMLQDGSQTILISDGKVLTVLDPVKKEMKEVEITEEVRAQLDQTASGLDSVYTMSQNRAGKYKEDTVTIDEITYTTETFESEGEKATFAFDSGDRLCYLITESGGESSQLKIISLDGNVKDSQFAVPEGYTMVTADPDDLPDDLTSGKGSGKADGGDDTGNDKGSPKDGSSKGSIGSDLEVRNEYAGYAFQTDRAFHTENSEDMTTVYTKDEGKTPKFFVYPYFMDEGKTPDDIIDEQIDDMLGNDEMNYTVEPQKCTTEINGESWPGVIYAVASNDKSKNLYIQSYLCKSGYMHYRWTAQYVTGDEQTVEDMKHAMSTFEMLAG